MVRTLVWLVVLTGAGAGGYLWLFREAELEVTAVRVARGAVEQTVSAISSGTVKPEYDAAIASEYVGTVLSLPFKEGATVEPGDLLVESDHTEVDAQLALAEANLRAGLSRLEQAKLAADIYKDVSAAQVSQAGAQVEQARHDFERAKALSGQGAMSRSEYDRAASAFKVASETLAGAQASQRENELRQEEIVSAEAAVEQLQAAVDAARAMQQKAFVRAPFPGVIAHLFVDPGESVALGMPLVQLVQRQNFYVEAPFDEADAADIALGQKVRVNIDAYRGQDFYGRVTYISPIVTLNPDLSRTLNVRVRMDEGQDKFVAGMSADVIAIVDEKQDALYVPSEALVRQEWAYVVENGRAVRRQVSTGVGNWSTIEVTDGLKEGEELITSVSLRDLQDGVRIRVVESLD